MPALVKASAARNALDCALWDLEAKRRGRPVWQLAGLPQPRPLVTAYTLSLADPAAMGEAAAEAAGRPLLKLKLGGRGDRERLAAVRRSAPAARLIVDANEGWAETELPAMFAACAEFGVELIEQPLPAGRDAALAGIERPVPVCADESIHVAADLAALAGRYDAINIKLDKTGGLTEALALADAAAARSMRLMVGCMVATSLAMAPAIAGGAAGRLCRSRRAAAAAARPRSRHPLRWQRDESAAAGALGLRPRRSALQPFANLFGQSSCEL